jgi:hypothetical protein
MPTTSRGIRETTNKMAGAKEIAVPYLSIQSKYPQAVADVLDQRVGYEGKSKDQVFNTDPSRMIWRLAYIQPHDPSCDNEDDFVAALATDTKVCIKASCANWRGVVELHGLPLPVQIMDRLRERAKVICGNKDEPEVINNVEENVVTIDMVYQKLCELEKLINRV